MKNPKVTFLTLTYGRAAVQPDLLNEAVFWMLQQDMDDYEILIVNDAPGQTLYCEEPRVRILNLKERCPDLGTKSNHGCLAAGGDVVVVNDDDDISLPWRASQAVERLTESVANLDPYDYWAPHYWLYEQKGHRPVADRNGYSYNCSAFRRDAMHHPKTIKGHDAAAALWAAENLKCNQSRLIDPRDISFVYRFGFSHAHLSGFGDRAEDAFKSMPCGPPGDYVVVPKPGPTDYVAVHKTVTGRR